LRIDHRDQIEMRRVQPEIGFVKSTVLILAASLLVFHDDDRASVTVVTPEGKKFPLEFWDVVTPAFSDLGAKAEWRILRDREKVTPIALIVRVKYTGKKSAAAAPTATSVLAVAKITPESVCVVRAVQDGPRANEQARKAADAASTRPCLHRPP
jgi:hypothetical protein